ncbi:MAG: hypothetical protein IJJ71_02350 [Treponema sp.]|uniref:hypothetical protein n=1 Tax=Treponema sp. TaxID=166 RepID=UPI0025F0A3F8|nr:hypothetical protein [Treponema sp.]MBR0495000.1 hypothetical protein [Treponema sp.]
MLNTNLFHIYFNKSPYKYVEKKDCISFTDYVLPIGTSELCNYYLLIKCTDGNTYPVQFGACAILEGMARILENHLYPSPDNGRWQIPYDLPYLFANTVLPEFAIKQENIFALCDISLQMYNPAEVFYNLLYIMKDEHFIPSDLESFYNYSYSKIEKMYKIKFTDIWNKSVEDARYNLKNAVNLPECQYAVTWADNVIETYTQKRDSDKVFLSRFMSMDRATAEVEYFKLIREVVSPIIYNKKNQYSIMIDHQEDAPLDIDQLAYWIHISRMYNYIYTKNCNCPYDDICTEECNDRTNPLRHSDICLFTQYGRNFGLNHKKVLKP